MQTEHHRQETISIPLQSLPLRPSTLIALIRRGFATTGDLMDSCQTEMTSTEDGNHDRSGNNGSKNTGENISLSNFANELGCSTSQAADYAHEINDCLGSIGLPKVTAENIAKGINEHKHGGDTNENTMAPRPSILPATAASILRSKGNSRGRQIVSFAQPLDKLLGGGFALTELTEITGMPGTGKTQLAMQLCVDTRLPNNYGGVEGCAVVVDAEGSWSCAAGGDRLWSMAVALVDHVKRIALRKAEGTRTKERAGVNVSEQDISWLTPEFILSGIFVFRVHDEASQTCTLYNLPNVLLEQEKNGTPVKLVVIDSLAFHYRVASSSSFTDVEL